MEKVDSRLNSPILSAQNEIEKQFGWDLRMKSIFAITIPAHPRDFYQKFAPTRGFCILDFARGDMLG